MICAGGGGSTRRLQFARVDDLSPRLSAHWYVLWLDRSAPSPPPLPYHNEYNLNEISVAELNDPLFNDPFFNAPN